MPSDPSEDPAGPSDSGQQIVRPPRILGLPSAASPEQARSWIRWAWIAALVFCVWQTWWVIIGLVTVIASPGLANLESTNAAENGPTIPGDQPQAVIPAPGVAAPDPATPDIVTPDVGPLILAAIEAIIIGGLALGVRQSFRPAAILLAGGFFASRIAGIAIGLISVNDVRDALWLFIFGVLLFFFVRGVQGTFSFHWYTHLRFPVSPRERP